MDTDLAIQVADALIRRFEGLRLRPYLCPAGVPTIGYGATYYENGVHVTLFDPAISSERAEQLLIWMVKVKYLPSVQMLCPGIPDADKLAALIDFTYNLGSNALKHSTLRRRVNAGRWGDVPKEIMKWRFAGGKELRGLLLRRQADAALI